jgi:hypothetical protein
MTDKVVKVKLSSLIKDYNLYPRAEIQSVHVGEILEAMKAGVEMPMIVVDAKTSRIVDGWHRVSAYEKLYDNPDAEIKVIKRTYPSEKEVWLDAMRLNASHGARLSAWDKARCIAKSNDLGIDEDEIAAALNITREKIDEIVKIKFGTSPDNESVPLKQTTHHMSGHNMTKKQVAYNNTAGGMHQLFYVNQVITMIESGSVDWDNENLVAGLAKLGKLIDKTLATKV